MKEEKLATSYLGGKLVLNPNTNVWSFTKPARLMLIKRYAGISFFAVDPEDISYGVVIEGSLRLNGKFSYDRSKREHWGKWYYVIAEDILAMRLIQYKSYELSAIALFKMSLHFDVTTCTADEYPTPMHRLMGKNIPIEKFF